MFQWRQKVNNEMLDVACVHREGRDNRVRPFLGPFVHSSSRFMFYVHKYMIKPMSLEFLVLQVVLYKEILKSYGWFMKRDPY